jgi:hypothetical protein
VKRISGSSYESKISIIVEIGLGILTTKLSLVYLNQHASRYVQIFINILKMFKKVKSCEMNKDINSLIHALQTVLTCHKNCQIKMSSKYGNLALTALVMQ